MQDSCRETHHGVEVAGLVGRVGVHVELVAVAAHVGVEQVASVARLRAEHGHPAGVLQTLGAAARHGLALVILVLAGLALLGVARGRGGG